MRKSITKTMGKVVNVTFWENRFFRNQFGDVVIAKRCVSEPVNAKPVANDWIIMDAVGVLEKGPVGGKPSFREVKEFVKSQKRIARSIAG